MCALIVTRALLYRAASFVVCGIRELQFEARAKETKCATKCGARFANLQAKKAAACAQSAQGFLCAAHTQVRTKSAREEQSCGSSNSSSSSSSSAACAKRRALLSAHFNNQQQQQRDAKEKGVLTNQRAHLHTKPAKRAPIRRKRKRRANKENKTAHSKELNAQTKPRASTESREASKSLRRQTRRSCAS